MPPFCFAMAEEASTVVAGEGLKEASRLIRDRKGSGLESIASVAPMPLTWDPPSPLVCCVCLSAEREEDELLSPLYRSSVDSSSAESSSDEANSSGGGGLDRALAFFALRRDWMTSASSMTSTSRLLLDALTMVSNTNVISQA